MSNRYIIIPPDAEFRDQYTKEIVMAPGPNGAVVKAPNRSFDWFMYVHILSHLQFSMEVGGYDAKKSGKQIGKAMEKAIDDGESFFEVTADQWRQLNCTTARPADKDSGEILKEKPNLKILARSSHGMTRKMDNFTADCFMEFMDAIANASTNKPEPAKKAEPAGATPPPPIEEEATQAQSGAN